MNSPGKRIQTALRHTSSVASHGEGPFWDTHRGRLLCLDVFAGTVISVNLDGKITRYPAPSSAVTVIRRRTAGGFVIATEHGLITADEEFQKFGQIAQVIDDPAVRTNDGGCVPLGGFVIGTMAYDTRTEAGSVYRVTPDRTVKLILSGVSISNGVQWSSDGSRVFYIDTRTNCVDVFDFSSHTGDWSERRTFIRIKAADGHPDGMAIDEDDGLWIALWGGGAVHHYDRHGTLSSIINVPGVSHVSSCAFGGPERTTLFITTSRQGISDDAEPYAGGIFVAQTDMRGAALSEFRG